MDFICQVYLLKLFRTTMDSRPYVHKHNPVLYTIFWMNAQWDFNKSIIYSTVEHLTQLQKQQ